MNKLIVLLVLATFFLSCNNNRKWTAADRSKFVKDCTNEAKSGAVMTEDQARSYCECMQPKVEAKYPTIAEANKLKSSDMQSPEWMDEAKKCLGMGNLNINKDNGDANPVDNTSTVTTNDEMGWSASQRTQFVTDCYNEAKAGMGEEKARNYCECMQPKLEAKYRSFTEANKITEAELQSDEWLKEVRACLGY
jgi:hypothetical protein